MTVTVGLLADPGLPLKIAEEVAEGLPEALEQQVGGAWRVPVRCRSLMLNEDGEIPVAELAEEERTRNGWDLLVCVTDLPRVAGGGPVIADVNRTHEVALASLPGVGAVRLRAHLRSMLVRLVAELMRRPVTGRGPVRRVPDDGEDFSLALTGVRGRLRLLLGMVRYNRPWRMVPSLSRALAAAAATAAFGVFYSSIWSMADALSPLRLALVTVFAVGAMGAWLVIHNGLWEHPSRLPTHAEAAVYNSATIVTVTFGVACMYVLLFALTLVAALVVIDGGYLGRMLGHPADFGSYLKLSWLACSMGTVAGALGSSLESEQAVRRATYSKREQERRERQRA